LHEAVRMIGLEITIVHSHHLVVMRGVDAFKVPLVVLVPRTTRIPVVTRGFPRTVAHLLSSFARSEVVRSFSGDFVSRFVLL
jgi:hypothetical protein